MKINVVIIGHVDHGKSTLIGRLLYDSDSITEGRVSEIQKLVDEYKRKFEFAYFIDSFDDEIKEERTIDTTGIMFKSAKNLYAVSDVPGHKEFIKNMLTGASHADVAVLVVSALDGLGEQTRRHAFLINMLGIKKVFVLVNKMDAVKYSQEAFEGIKQQIVDLLNSFGYQAEAYIPGSAMEGDNVYKPSKNMPWYTGQTLIQALDAVELPAHLEKTLRFVVQDNYSDDGGKITVGRVESGVLTQGDNVIFQPSGLKAKVDKIKVFEGELPRAETGDAVGIIVKVSPKRGDVLGTIDNPPVAVREFLGEVVLLENKLSKGDVVELMCGTARTSARIKEIKEKINSETGEVMEKNPAFISENEAATIIFTTEPLVVENFADIPELGRFVLARDGRSIGAGIVLEKAL